MEKNGNPEKRQEFLKVSLLSVSLFLITYFVVVFITGLSELYIAYDFDIPATLCLKGTSFHISDSDPLWTRDALTSILLATPVSSFVISMGAVFMFIVRKQKTEILLYTSIWLLLQSFNMTFGLISENLITQSGVSRVAELQGLGRSAIIISVGLAFYLMFQFGAFTARLLLAHGSATFREHRYTTVIAFFILPWFFGNLILLALIFPDIGLKDFLVKLMMLIMLLPAFFVRLPNQEPTKKSSANLLIILPLLSLVVTWISVAALQKCISF
ncbi:MAG TPA: hypothetical protein PKE03_03270 [Bacteroidales bacterium]|nr:hypothetical protein [Bacteroidales bacterium]